jgi:hypothetical protein
VGDGLKRPNCEAIKDALEDMERTALEEMDDVGRHQLEHEQRCHTDVANINAKIEAEVNHLQGAESYASEAFAARSQVHAELIALEQDMAALVDRVREMQAKCTDALQRLEDEACSLIEVRQGLYWREVNDDSSIVIQDCEVGDWTEGVCSRSCSEVLGEAAGTSLSQRPVLLTPDKKSAEGAFGASCPALEQVHKCAEEACPTDCELSSWSDWASCSRRCGGGEQFRTRAVERAGLTGGKLCESTVESRQCHIEACTPDCPLGDWSDWTSCSRLCRWSSAVPAGRASRTRPVMMTTPHMEDSCPSEAERTQFQDCNDVACPPTLNCSSDEDVIFVIDGSGSTVPVDAGESKNDEERNFREQKAFVENFVENSTMLGDSFGSDDQIPHAGMRFGVVVIGGETRPKYASMLAGGRSEVLEGLRATTFPGGKTHIAPALQAATQLFRLTNGETSTAVRKETVVLITDGKSRHSDMVGPAATRLKEAGVRLMAALVQDSSSPNLESAGHFLCEVAGNPCADNVLTVDRYEDLNSQLSRFVAAICTR